MKTLLTSRTVSIPKGGMCPALRILVDRHASAWLIGCWCLAVSSALGKLAALAPALSRAAVIQCQAECPWCPLLPALRAMHSMSLAHYNFSSDH